MSQLWFVYSRDKTLGPWSSSEIRDQLRAGNVDPFDMVSSDGSPVKRPLVEVDEIFQTSRIQMAAIIENGIIDESKGVVGGYSPSKPTAVSEETSTNRQDLAIKAPISSPPSNNFQAQPRPKQFQALAIESRPAVQRFSKPGKRHYLVIDSAGRVLGPMSSVDVISLWQKGIVDRSSSVEKKGHSRKIPLEKFVSFYQLGGSHSDPGIRLGGDGLQRYFNYRFKDAVINHRNNAPTLALVCALILVIGVLGYRLLTSSNVVLKTETSVPKASRSEALSPSGPSVISKNPNTSSIDGAQPEPIQIVPHSREAKRIESAHKNERPKNSRRSQFEVNQTSRPIQARSATSPSRVPSTKQASPRKSPVRQDSFRNNQPNRATQPKPLSVQVSPPKQKRNTETPQKLIDGKPLKIVARYSSQAVQSCAAKCKLEVQTSQGPLTAVFFKAAFGDKLTSANGSASLSGTVRRQSNGSWHLIVNEIIP